MDTKTRDIRAWCGLTGVVLLVLSVLLMGLSPGYSHFTQWVSALGAEGAPLSWLMNTCFLIAGLLIIAFSTHHSFGRRGIPLTVAGIGFILIAIFPCEPGCANSTLPGTLHLIFSGIAGAGIVFSPLVLAGRFRKRLSLVFFAVLLVLGLTLLFLDVSWLKIAERVFFGLGLLWIGMLSCSLLRSKISRNSRNRTTLRLL